MAAIFIIIGLSLFAFAAAAVAVQLNKDLPFKYYIFKNMDRPETKKAIGPALVFGSIALLIGLGMAAGPQEVKKAPVSIPDYLTPAPSEAPLTLERIKKEMGVAPHSAVANPTLLARIAEAHKMVDEDETIKGGDKQLLKAAAENVLTNEPKCLQAFTAGKSFDGSGKYFVNCSGAEGSFNVYFTKKELQGGTTLAKPIPVSEDKAFVACRDAVRSRLDHPSTFKSAFIPAESKTFPQGHVRVELYFSAQNSYGLRTDQTGYCNVMPSGDVEILSVKERI